MDNRVNIVSLECLLKVGDTKGRIVIPSNVIKLLNLNVGMPVECMYLVINHQRKVSDFNPTLLPYKETVVISSNNRFQVPQNTRKYLRLENGDYIKTIVSNPANYLLS